MTNRFDRSRTRPSTRMQPAFGSAVHFDRGTSEVSMVLAGGRAEGLQEQVILWGSSLTLSIRPRGAEFFGLGYGK